MKFLSNVFLFVSRVQASNRVHPPKKMCPQTAKKESERRNDWGGEGIQRCGIDSCTLYILCFHFAFFSCLVSTKGTKKGKQTRQPVAVVHAMEGVGGKSIAGKAMSSMSGEKLADVEENLCKTLKKNVNKAVKQTVLEVFIFFIPFQIAFNTSSNMTTCM